MWKSDTTKSHKAKFRRIIVMFVKVTGEKIVGGFYAPPNLE